MLKRVKFISFIIVLCLLGFTSCETNNSKVQEKTKEISIGGITYCLDYTESYYYVDDAEDGIVEAHIVNYIEGVPVTKIGTEDIAVLVAGPFEYCENLKKVYIPNTITVIGHDAFRGCSSLEEIVLPDSITIIGDDAFSYCTSLETIYMSKNLKKIDGNAFECCNFTEIIIPREVTEIGYRAFLNCDSLTTIHFPKSLKKIDKMAFWGCPIETIYYEGSENDWNQIKIGEHNDKLEVTYFNSYK